MNANFFQEAQYPKQYQIQKHNFNYIHNMKAKKCGRIITSKALLSDIDHESWLKRPLSGHKDNHVYIVCISLYTNSAFVTTSVYREGQSTPSWRLLTFVRTLTRSLLSSNYITQFVSTAWAVLPTFLLFVSYPGVTGMLFTIPFEPPHLHLWIRSKALT